MSGLVKWKMMLGLLLCLMVGTVSYGQAQGAAVSPELRQKVEKLIQDLARYGKEKNADAIIKILEPEHLKEIVGSSKSTPQAIIKKNLGDKAYTAIQAVVTDVQCQGDKIMVRAVFTSKWRSDKGKDESETDREILVLSQKNGQLLIKEKVQEVSAEDFDPKTGVYQSKKGNYTLNLPAQWIPIKNENPELKALASDSVIIMGPSMASSVILGFIQLPMKMDADKAAGQAVGADYTIEKAMTQNNVLKEQGPFKAGALTGGKVVTEFKAEGKQYYRERIYLYKEPFIYFSIFSATDPKQFAAERGGFEKIMQSFKIRAPKPGLTTQEEVAGQLAKGSVAGQNYTNKEHNCFIAAPEGWAIRTSPNPAQLVEMQYKKGKSIARLIAAKGIKPEQTAKQLFEGRLVEVKKLLKDMKEISRRDVTIQGCPGIESVQTYSVPMLGNFHVKEVTLVKNGTYYLILCQAIEPDKYEVLEKDFDQIIQSFGFIQ